MRTAILSVAAAGLAAGFNHHAHPASAAVLWGSASLCVAALANALGAPPPERAGARSHRAIALGMAFALVVRPGRFLDTAAQAALIAAAALLAALGQGGRIDAFARRAWARCVDAPGMPGDQVLHGAVAGLVLALPLGDAASGGDPGLARVVAALAAFVAPWMVGTERAPVAGGLPPVVAAPGPVLADDLPPPGEVKPPPRLRFSLNAKSRPGQG